MKPLLILLMGLCLLVGCGEKAPAPRSKTPEEKAKELVGKVAGEQPAASLPELRYYALPG